MTGNIRIEGMADLERALRELRSATTARRIGRKASEEALQPVLAAAKAAAPRSSVGGKHYADTIAVSGRLNRSQAKEERRTPGIRQQDVIIRYVGSSSPLAHLIEFGTGGRRQKSTGRFTGAMPPQPHLRTAWEENGEQVLVLLSKALRAELDKSLARIAKRADNFARKHGK